MAHYLFCAARQVQVQRRGDAEAAGDSSCAVLLPQLRQHLKYKVRRADREGRRRVLQRFAQGSSCALCVDESSPLHQPQHHALPGLRGARVGQRVVLPRCLRQAGEQRTLGQVKLHSGLAKVRLRSRLQPKRQISVINVVQVQREDLRFG